MAAVPLQDWRAQIHHFLYDHSTADEPTGRPTTITSMNRHSLHTVSVDLHVIRTAKLSPTWPNLVFDRAHQTCWTKMHRRQRKHYGVSYVGLNVHRLWLGYLEITSNLSRPIKNFWYLCCDMHGRALWRARYESLDRHRLRILSSLGVSDIIN